MPLVSIVVPCFAVEGHIEKTLASLTSQTYSNLEIILVDDGNEKALNHIIAENLKQDNRLKVIRHKTNQGLSSARNTGLKNATGEYVLFWDADDHLYSDTVETLIAKAIKNAAQVVRGVLARTDGNQTWVTKRGRRLLHNKPQTSFENSLELAMDFTSCGILFSKKFLDNHQLNFEPDLYMQDILFTSNVLLLANKITMCEHVVGEYFQSADSASRLRSSKRFESLFILYEKLEDLFHQRLVGVAQRETILASFINAGVNTFLLWKLESYETNVGDLDRLSMLLSEIGENAINQYCMDMFDEPSFLRLHATRIKNYELAAMASHNSTVSNQQLRDLCGPDSEKYNRACDFLNRLRTQRDGSKVNSRLVLDTTKPSRLLVFGKLKNLVSWMKSKLSSVVK